MTEIQREAEALLALIEYDPNDSYSTTTKEVLVGMLDLLTSQQQEIEALRSAMFDADERDALIHRAEAAEAERDRLRGLDTGREKCDNGPTSTNRQPERAAHVKGS